MQPTQILKQKSKVAGDETTTSPRFFRHISPYLYLAPALIFIGLFVFYPLVGSVRNSFYQGNLINPTRQFIGLQTYIDVLTDDFFYVVLLQSGIYLLFALLGAFVVPIILALFAFRLNERELDIYQSSLFLPTVIATNVAVLVWIWFYLPAGGLVATLLKTFNLPTLNLLKDPLLALPAVSLVANWKIVGFHFLIALAGLKAIPREYIEAAVVDGAEGWALMRRVVLPLFSPTALFLFIITLIQGLEQVFVPIEVMTRGGPSNATNNLMYAIYQEGFKYFRVGYASVLSIILIVLFGGLIYIQYRLLERTVEYDR